MTTRILVANSSEALLFDAEKLRTQDLHLVEKFVHPDSRKKNADLSADRYGVASNRPNRINSTYEGHHTPKEVESENFALELVAKLHSYCDACNHGENTHLLIVAPDHFYSLFLKHWHCCCIGLEHLAKDYTKLPVKELSAALRKHLYEK